ncbi:hypothetical protein RJ639_001524 [Escallonia herrerae]|uniref:NADP-dependent oxidoreductase domain-containing protein n=1 Tax=Escallonia herrerae TaxID=1293975 RepID=A0AA88X731_9ASTE|nr:hypothetical protein RJ639_001524 [Escallonia herrerae]
MAAFTVHQPFSNPNSTTKLYKIGGRTGCRRRHGAGPVRCEVGAAVNRQVKVSNGGDSVEICRVLNGMWQTSGGWGRIERDDAVEAMLRYADAGLSTFDMADHCNLRTCLFSMALCFPRVLKDTGQPLIKEFLKERQMSEVQDV